MRTYFSVEEALSEIQRDVYKGSKYSSTRVQALDYVDLETREVMPYQYSISTANWPTALQMIELGEKLGLEFYTGEQQKKDLANWMQMELNNRLSPEYFFGDSPTENFHPGLKKHREGGHFGYTYQERLYGMFPVIKAILEENPDSRRAYWPIFLPQDVIRGAYPTRIPCSLGYGFAIRMWRDENALVLNYLMRSSDFDTFFLTDVWLAREIQEKMADDLGVNAGPFIHTILSLHSFDTSQMEVY